MDLGNPVQSALDCEHVLSVVTTPTIDGLKITWRRGHFIIIVSKSCTIHFRIVPSAKRTKCNVIYKLHHEKIGLHHTV